MVLRLFPQPTVQLAVEDVYQDVSFPARRILTEVPEAGLPPKTRPYVIINMVSSLDGKATVHGKAGSIGSLTDRTIMRTLRSRADAVMIGAGTLRSERLRLDVPEYLVQAREALNLRPQPLAVIATESGDLPLERNLLGSSPENLLILASPHTPEEKIAAFSAHASVEVLQEEDASAPRPDPTVALQILKRRYAVSVLMVEGGPALIHSLVRRGLVDELFLALAPRLLGGVRPNVLTILEGPTLPPQIQDPEILSVHLAGDELFLRYVLR
jgi:riboflavin-specific deaminase-like protein